MDFHFFTCAAKRCIIGTWQAHAKIPRSPAQSQHAKHNSKAWSYGLGPDVAALCGGEFRFWQMTTHLLHPVSAIPSTSLLLEILDMISTHCRLFDTCLDIVTKSELGPVAPKQQRTQNHLVVFFICSSADLSNMHSLVVERWAVDFFMVFHSLASLFFYYFFISLHRINFVRKSEGRVQYAVIFAAVKKFGHRKYGQLSW